MEEIEVVAGCPGAGQTIGDVRGGAFIVGVRQADGSFLPVPAAETALGAGRRRHGARHAEHARPPRGAVRHGTRRSRPGARRSRRASRRVARCRPGTLQASSPTLELRAAVGAASGAVAGADGRAAAAPTLERPKKAGFGDYATNAAMLLAPRAGAPPRDVAGAARRGARARALGAALDRVEVAGPGLPEPLPVRRLVRRARSAHVLAAGDAFGGGGAERPPSGSTSSSSRPTRPAR